MSLNPVTTPTVSKSIKMTHLKQNKGFSILEVLVALGVLAIGLLGLAAMQTMGLKLGHQSYQRTQATMLIYQMVDRIRANPQGAYTGFGPTATAPGTSPADKCYTSICSPDEMAAYDQKQWIDSINNSLSQGQGSIALSSSADTNRFAISVQWAEGGTTKTQSIEAEL